MKLYFAGRTSSAAAINTMIEQAEEDGHEITYKWTESDLLYTRPYPIDFAGPEAKKELDGVLAAEVFVLISDKAGTGMYVELGFALAQNMTIYSVGEHHDTTLFQHLPEIKRVNTFADVLDDLKK